MEEKTLERINLVTDFCLNSNSTNPLEMAIDIMKLPQVPMISGLHHPIIAGVLVTAYKNKTGQLTDDDIKLAIRRGSTIPAGFCALYGSDGAALATGIAMSVIQKTSPLAEKDIERSIAHRMTSLGLSAIANNRGNRCCKRSTFDVINAANQYIREALRVELDQIPLTKQNCEFSQNFELCNKEICRYYQPLI